MLTDLIIKNYQSIKDATLKLAPFTVITGATGSGKSASRRAAELVAFNARGTSYITQGEKSATVGLGCDEGWAVTITRGSRGNDSYRLASVPPTDGQLVGRPVVAGEYTKLAGQVPEEVTRVLQLSEINFAGQFDGPYLLTNVSGGDVARVLGQLTNVTLIFNAAREAARRRKGIAADLKAAEAEITRLQAEAQRFATLGARLQALQEAEAAQARLTEVQGRRDRLSAFLGSLRAAQQVLEASPPVVEVPDLTALEQAWARKERLAMLVRLEQDCQRGLQAAVDAVTRWAGAAMALDQEFHLKLADAGTCPLCGSQVTSA